MILVTGATGNVGSSVVGELAEHGVAVRAFVRDPATAVERLGADVEIAVGDFADPSSLARALGGVEAMFLSSADGPDKVAFETAAIDAAASAGVRRIVKCSTVRAEKGSPLPPFDWHGRIEQHLRAAGPSFVILRSAFYMTNLLSAAEPVRHTGSIFAPAGGAKIAMIDPRDTGAVGAVALTTDAYDDAILELTGPEAITYEQIAEDLSAATGRKIGFVDIPDEAAREALTGAGLPGWLVEHLGRLFPLLREGALDQPTDTVRAVTGRDARSFATFARDYASAFAA